MKYPAIREHGVRHAVLLILSCLVFIHGPAQSQRAWHPPPPHEIPHVVEPPRPDRPPGTAGDVRPIDPFSNATGRAGGPDIQADPRLQYALAEVGLVSTIFAPTVRSDISDHPCCHFARPIDTKFADVYDAAERYVQAHYFSAAFKAKQHRFVFTTDDTSILDMLDNADEPYFERASGSNAWSSELAIQNRLAKLRDQLGEGGRVILVGHQEHGEIVIRDPQGDRNYDIKNLQALALKQNIELLVWSCESSRHVIGGIEQAFRESTLTRALLVALEDPPDTWAGFLDQIAKNTEVNWEFNAVQLMGLQQAVATVIDKSGRAVEVQMPAVPRNAGSSPGADSTPVAQQGEAWMSPLGLLRIAFNACWTVFILTLIVMTLVSVLSLYVDGIKYSFYLAANLVAAVLGLFAAAAFFLALMQLSPAMVGSGILLAALAWLDYRGMKWLHNDNN